MHTRRPTSQFPAPSRTDLEILAVLWDQRSATSRAIYDALLDTGRLQRRIAYTTIRPTWVAWSRRATSMGDPLGMGEAPTATRRWSPGRKCVTIQTSWHGSSARSDCRPPSLRADAMSTVSSASRTKPLSRRC
jgi:hypothetical protein